MGNTHAHRIRGDHQLGREKSGGAWNQRVFYHRYRMKCAYHRQLGITKYAAVGLDKPKYFQMYLEGQLVEKSPAPTHPTARGTHHQDGRKPTSLSAFPGPFTAHLWWELLKERWAWNLSNQALQTDCLRASRPRTSLSFIAEGTAQLSSVQLAWDILAWGWRVSPKLAASAFTL